MKHQKILLLDIETAPILGNVWQLWKQTVGLNQIERDWYILSFCAKWLGDDEIIYMDQRNADDLEDDTALLLELHRLLDEAEHVVAHNGRKFDIKKIRARMILQGLEPYSPAKIIDTLDIAKREFGFTSNKLEYLSDKIAKTKKLSHAKFPGFELWKECLAGNPEAWEEMREYNIVDVLALEEVYLALRPWDSRHPWVAPLVLGEERATCPKCGSAHVQSRGTVRTLTGLEYRRYRCNDCGGWSRARNSVTLGKDRADKIIPQ